MLKRRDYFILSVICFFLGIFIISQYYAGEETKKLSEPESNAILAIEVAKLTKTNADLRQEVKKLTADLDTYQNSNKSQKIIYDKYIEESAKYDLINGLTPKEGQGVVIMVSGRMSLVQSIDLVNALKNIGSPLISINGHRVLLSHNLASLAGQSYYEIAVIGNSSLIKSAMERKGGIIEQIASKDLKITVSQRDKVIVPIGNPLQFDYAKIINSK